MGRKCGTVGALLWAVVKTLWTIFVVFAQKWEVDPCSDLLEKGFGALSDFS